MLKTENRPELWGGLECTINRVGDRYLDQFALGGVYDDPRHDQIAALGVRKLRFPVLWERHQPGADGNTDWSFTDNQLAYYRGAGVAPIATLVHHGSGPKHTSLMDERFPELLAAYALEVAQRYPWLEHYTPVNEPLTTARFSGLYGHWYPHGTDERSFLRCLYHELKGVVLSMQAIRTVNPKAKLVQTEDLAKTYSTPLLAYQARFENQRRWLTYDLLCGMVDHRHPLYAFLVSNGLTPKELQFFVDNVCVPNVFGFNYYITSERYLDEHLERFPGVGAGGNGRHRYVDVEAVRMPLSEPTGVKVLLQEAWDRYRKPLAVTEVHLHCHREEQLRWFRYVHDSCCELVGEGVEIQAVTAWALLGSYGWNKLLTVPECEYEAGAFDLRGGVARPTALARYIAALGNGSADRHLAEAPGWWHRDGRFIDPCIVPSGDLSRQRQEARPPILVIGKRGTLGRAFARVCRERALAYVVAGREDCDITDPASIQAALTAHRPWAVINAAGYVRVDEAEQDAARCLQENHLGPLHLAQACKKAGIPLVSFSSDLVFDGTKEDGYVESDIPAPLNVYGHSKALAEQAVLDAHPAALMVRTSAFFGPWDRYNFLYWVEHSLKAGESIPVAADLFVSPTYVPDLVNTTLDLLIDRESGIWHLVNEGRLSWAELARAAAERLGLDGSLLTERTAAEMGWAAPRPRNSVLRSERAPLLPDVRNALNRYFAERKRFEELPD